MSGGSVGSARRTVAGCLLSKFFRDLRCPLVCGWRGRESQRDQRGRILRTHRRVLAQVEVTFSNSMVEAFWRSLKHSWIYLHSLDTAAALRRLVEFYVTAHNELMPHSAFEGQTPDEMYFGTGGEVAINLAIARQTARDERIKANRAARCGVCTGEGDPRALQLQRPRSRRS
jgi:putative transposase